MAMNSYEDFLRLYPFLASLKDLYPVTWYPPEFYPGTLGYASGTRYDPGTKKGVRIALGQKPSEELDTRRHEFTHAAIEESPNWQYIMSILNPTKGLGHELGMDYFHPDIELRHQLWVEEMMNRFLAEVAIKDYIRRKDELLDPKQQLLLPYLEKYTKHGPTWGSFWGEDWPGKGQNIYPGQLSDFLTGR